MLDSNKYKTKRYTHFDYRVNIDRVKSYVMNPDRIAKHSFLPFIHYISSFEKYLGHTNPDLNNRPIETKNRDIMYAGHLDNFIYKYYAEKLNYKYNCITEKVKIDECSTAYRDNKDGQSNIDFAADVINTIVNYKDAYIMVGDFTKFFDEIDHKALKNRLLEVLKVNRLSNDWYNIYKSITKFGYYEKTLLIEKLQKKKKCEKINKKAYFKSVKEFRKFQRLYPCKKNKEVYGIPQGTAISAVFANVYAINFDIAIKQISEKYNGIYRRYSDDFVLVIPKKQGDKILSFKEFKKLEMTVRVIAENNKIKIQESKTELLELRKQEIYNLADNKKGRLDYLGFIFDGKRVKMRGKSPYKFYREAYKLIARARKIKNKNNLSKIPYRKQIYGLYTDLGIKRGTYGNFISYAKRSQEKFDILSPLTINLMTTQIKNRKKKIEGKLGVRIHTHVR